MEILGFSQQTCFARNIPFEHLEIFTRRKKDSFSCIDFFFVIYWLALIRWFYSEFLMIDWNLLSLYNVKQYFVMYSRVNTSKMEKPAYFSIFLEVIDPTINLYHFFSLYELLYMSFFLPINHLPVKSEVWIDSSSCNGHKCLITCKIQFNLSKLILNYYQSINLLNRKLIFNLFN